GARPVIDQRQLAKMLADPKHAENHLAAVLADEHDLHASLPHDEQRVAGIVLEQDHAAARIKPFARQVGKPLELGSIKSVEQLHCREKVYGRRGHGLCSWQIVNLAKLVPQAQSSKHGGLRDCAAATAQLRDGATAEERD